MSMFTCGIISGAVLLVASLAIAGLWMLAEWLLD